MKVLKLFGGISLLVVVVGVSIYLYMFREQELDLSYIPSEFDYCGKTISKTDIEYQEIVSWLENNSDGWEVSYVSYVPKQVYRHPAFVVNVLDGGVVVSYKTDIGYPQYAKTIDHGMELACIETS